MESKLYMIGYCIVPFTVYGFKSRNGHSCTTKFKIFLWFIWDPKHKFWNKSGIFVFKSPPFVLFSTKFTFLCWSIIQNVHTFKVGFYWKMLKMRLLTDCKFDKTQTMHEWSFNAHLLCLMFFFNVFLNPRWLPLQTKV